jgi:predicted pyridoxine 5'-phosphate oxidase superfamily flavin-nucleotide-binding protein
MTEMLSDIAFTPAVKAEQSRRGSRALYARRDFRAGVRALDTFLAEVDTAYLATASAEGQPYAQHRGGPKGFIKIIDDDTVGFADYRGNQQYITTGNLSENDKAFLFLIDYANRRRVKLWGRARMVEDNDLIERLFDPAYAAAPERALVFTVQAFDVNCPQHIPQKVDAKLVTRAIAEYEARIRDLENEIALLKSGV